MKAKGDAGLKTLYHEGFQIELPYNNPSLYDGGNVLLRFSSIRNIVETSKGIKISLGECKRLWEIFKRWHNHSEQCEKGMVVVTERTDYHVHSFQNDILTIGCHQIAYSEMQRLATELNF